MEHAGAGDGGQKPGQDFFHCLDGIRGLAALLIVLRHTPVYFGSLVFPESYLAVDVFFLLSGVVIARSYEARLRAGLSAGRFFLIRMIRLYPFYLLGALTAMAALALEQVYGPAGFGYHVFGSLLFLPNPGPELRKYFPLNGPSWSLLFEIIVNMIYVVLLPWLDFRRLALVVAGAALALFASVAFYVSQGVAANFDIGYTVQTMPAAFFRALFSFFLGALIFRNFERRPYHFGGSPLALAILAATTAVLVASPRQDWGFAFDCTAVMVVFPALIFLAVGCRPTGAVLGLARFGGAISYGVYALHEPLGRLIRDLLFMLASVDVADRAPASGLALLFLLVGLVAVLDARYDQPVRAAWLQRLGARRTMAAPYAQV